MCTLQYFFFSKVNYLYIVAVVVVVVVVVSMIILFVFDCLDEGSL